MHLAVLFDQMLDVRPRIDLRRRVADVSKQKKRSKPRKARGAPPAGSQMYADRTGGNIAKQWAGAAKLKERMQRHAQGDYMGLPQPGARDALYTLAFVLVYDVLKRAQSEAADRHLPPFAQFGDMTDRRDFVAHDGVIHTSADSLKWIDEIENQLRAWKMI
jgi:hypothetical protein